MRLGEKLKYKARRYIYQIEQDAYVTKSKIDKENEKAQKIYNQGEYEIDHKQMKNMSSQSKLGSEIKADANKHDQDSQYGYQQKHSQQNYNYPYDTKDNVYIKSPEKKYKDSWYYDSTYPNGQYENNQKDYYDVYPEKYTGKSQSYSVSDEGYLEYQEKEYNKDKKIEPRKKLVAKLDELEDYLQQALSGSKKGKR